MLTPVKIQGGTGEVRAFIGHVVEGVFQRAGIEQQAGSVNGQDFRHRVAWVMAHAELAAPQDVQLGFAHRPLEAEQQAVAYEARREYYELAPAKPRLMPK